jgi:lipoprotein-releasing system permease protein
MNSLSLLLAYRYLRGTAEEKNIATMVKICFIGIFIGTFALTVVAAVMKGFEQVAHEKIQGINPSLVMRGYGNPLAYEAIVRLVNEELPQIEALAPSQSRHVIFRSPTTDDLNNVMILKGIDSQRELLVTRLGSKIVARSSAQENLTELLQGNQVLIGNSLAQHEGLGLGDQLTLYFVADHMAHQKINLESTQVIIAGTFDTGIEEYDTGIIFCSLNFLLSLFPDAGVGQIALKLIPGASQKLIKEQLIKRFEGLEIYSWEDLYRPLVAALKLEKYAMFLILALITLVASMNIISLLFMHITQKRGDLAILQALGYSRRSLYAIFMWMGLLLSLTASLLGELAAACTCWILNHYPFITLPDVYYTTHLPAHLDASLMVIVFFVTLALGLLATALATRQLQRIVVAQILRTEA